MSQVASLGTKFGDFVIFIEEWNPTVNGCVFHRR